MQEYDYVQDYQGTLEKMGERTRFYREFGEHQLCQNKQWNQYAFHCTEHMPEHWPEDLWHECWKDGYTDFTTDNWVNLSWQEQFQYAKSYQEWYMHYSCLYHTVYTAERAKLELQLIPPGKFWMGSPEDEKGRYNDETMRHRVLIDKPFYMGKYPVTQGQWQKVMGSNPAHFKESGENAPVEKVSWNDCQEFCKKLGGSLPTEAQWEYACRAGTTSVYNIGDSITRDKVNFDDFFSKTTPVGSLSNANSWGCYDFHGNVWEWCNDWYDDYTGDNTVNPTGPSNGSVCVLRGGCWNSRARYSRSAQRGGSTPDFRDFGFAGLRFVRGHK